MTTDLRVVFDTSVLISAVLFRDSVPRRAFTAALQEGRVLISSATIVELDEVLRRPKFDRYISEADRLDFLAAFLEETEIVEISRTVTACRDPRDNKFLECAANGEASYIVTGDVDLLILNPFEKTAIVTPQRFIEELEQNAGD